MTKPKPPWWPTNPYPEDIFPMTQKGFENAVPGVHTRQAIAGYLGRLFWGMASDACWKRAREYMKEKTDA